MESKGDLVVAFCGTNSAKDWFQNIDTSLTLRHGSYIHDGFWKALNVAWVGKAKLRNKLLAASGKKRIWFCGHRLGGALAVVAAYRCLHLKIPVEGVYTFGQPLVGEAALGSSFGDFSDRIYRFVNQGDPVPWIPMEGQMKLPKEQWTWESRGGGAGGKGRFGRGKKRVKTKKTSFKPVGQYYCFDANGRLKLGKKPQKMPGARIWGILKGVKNLVNGVLKIEKHNMTQYLRNLSNLK